eukprot:jgi/Bigna1/76235/fgenesh1_pg.40_\
MFKVRLSVGSKNVPGTVAGAGTAEDRFMGEQNVDVRGLPSSIDELSGSVREGRGWMGMDDGANMDLYFGSGADSAIVETGLIELGDVGYEPEGPIDEDTEENEETKKKDESKSKGAKGRSKNENQTQDSQGKKGGRASSTQHNKSSKKANQNKPQQQQQTKNKQPSNEGGKGTDEDNGHRNGGSTEPVPGGVVVHNGREIPRDEEMKFKSQRGRRNRRIRGKKASRGGGGGGGGGGASSPRRRNHSNSQRQQHNQKKAPDVAGSPTNAAEANASNSSSNTANTQANASKTRGRTGVHHQSSSGSSSSSSSSSSNKNLSNNNGKLSRKKKAKPGGGARDKIAGQPSSATPPPTSKNAIKNNSSSNSNPNKPATSAKSDRSGDSDTKTDMVKEIKTNKKLKNQPAAKSSSAVAVAKTIPLDAAIDDRKGGGDNEKTYHFTRAELVAFLRRYEAFKSFSWDESVLTNSRSQTLDRFFTMHLPNPADR